MINMTQESNQGKQKILAVLIVGMVLGIVLFTGASLFTAESPASPMNTNESVMDQQNGQTSNSASINDAQVNDSAVMEVRDQLMAMSFRQEIQQYQDNVRVLVSPDGQEILVTYESDATSPDQLHSQMTQIALMYAEGLENASDSRTLSIVVDKTQMVALQPVVEDYANGDLQRDAFLEMLRVTDVQRNN